MQNKIKIICNIVYIIGVICVIVLIAYTIYGNYMFEVSLNELILLTYDLTYDELLIFFSEYGGSPRYRPRYAIPMIGLGTFPMVITCLFVCKYNNVYKSEHKFWKSKLIFLPAYICIACLLYTCFELMVAYGMRDF